MISNKIVSNLNVFHLRVKYHILREVYGASVVILYRDDTKIKFVIRTQQQPTSMYSASIMDNTTLAFSYYSMRQASFQVSDT